VGAGDDQPGLALTFIRNLVADLREDLQGVADVFTFHGFCKHLLHRLRLPGLSDQVDFYPQLLDIIAEDITLSGIPASEATIKQALLNLDESGGLIKESIERGNYYGAVSFDDVVYRVLRYLEQNPSEIPEYPLIVVDEYQDFNRLETSFIAELAKVNPILVAGDDDQALYEFKHATPRYIRELAGGGSEYERFELPYCSRCTDVLVRAVNTVIIRAQKNGNLKGRLTRQYRCFLPDKKSDSDAHPKIIHTRCSVEMKSAPYMGRYVAQQIASITPDNVRESHENEYPTALVIGPKYFVQNVHGYLMDNGFPQAILRLSPPPKIDLLDGYSRLGRNEESRLGWRIVINCDRPKGYNELISGAINVGRGLNELIPSDYRDRHMENVRFLTRLIEEDTLSASEQQSLERALSRPIDEIKKDLYGGEDDDGGDDDDQGDSPSIICTTLVGAKGLSAGYVFVVGFNNQDFPYDHRAITDTEVCCFIVALSRARKSCHLVSCGRYAGEKRDVSAFLGWVDEYIEYRFVNKDYWT
jgi:superfamily I DNA/RNA helicase